MRDASVAGDAGRGSIGRVGNSETEGGIEKQMTVPRSGIDTSKRDLRKTREHLRDLSRCVDQALAAIDGLWAAWCTQTDGGMEWLRGWL